LPHTGSKFDKKNHRLLVCHWLGYRCSRQTSLAEATEYLGKVISVFDSNINIKTINDELFVVTLGEIRSPISLNVFPTSNLSSGFRRLVSYGSILRKQDNETLLIGKHISVDIKKSKIFKNNFEKPCFSYLKRFIRDSNNIFDTLLRTSRRGCLLDPDFTTEGILSKTLMQLQDYTATKNNKKFAKLVSNTLLELCGRGPGYTPSGDDFICGYCCLFNNLAIFLDIEKITLPHKKIANSTTWISCKFIQYYKRCIVDEQIQEMLNSIYSGDTEKYMSLLHQISYRGHTSGADIALGMTAALYTIVDREFHTQLLSMFPDKKIIEGSL
jgi:Protein of unknown function (DUF2877)